jgi:hypothetical protein
LGSVEALRVAQANGHLLFGDDEGVVQVAGGRGGGVAGGDAGVAEEHRGEDLLQALFEEDAAASPVHGAGEGRHEGELEQLAGVGGASGLGRGDEAMNGANAGLGAGDDAQGAKFADQGKRVDAVRLAAGVEQDPQRVGGAQGILVVEANRDQGCPGGRGPVHVKGKVGVEHGIPQVSAALGRAAVGVGEAHGE